MKRSVLILAITLTFNFFIRAQVPFIDLTFTSSFSGMFVPLDSILIQNVSKVADTVLYYPDTVLRLEYETGIGDGNLDRKGQFRIDQNFPNPFREKTSVDLWLPSNEEIALAIGDASGRLMFMSEYDLYRGLHRFDIRIPHSGNYVLGIYSGNEYRTVKLTSLSDDKGSFNVSYSGKVLEPNAGFKSSERKFPYEPGDVFRFIGFTGKDRDTLQDNPVASDTYEFIFQNGGFPCPVQKFVEYGGETYNTIQIGPQCWFRENLNFGEFISSNFPMADNDVIEKYCYIDLEKYCDDYGALYQWNELMDYTTEPGSQGICPEGWHVPDDEEWLEMVEFLGGDRDAGGMLKAMGTEFWDPPNTGATNVTGFTALPAGQMEGGGIYTGLGKVALFWSSTPEGLLLANYWELRHNSEAVNTDGYLRSRAFSVRCLRDDDQ